MEKERKEHRPVLTATQYPPLLREKEKKKNVNNQCSFYLKMIFLLLFFFVVISVIPFLLNELFVRQKMWNTCRHSFYAVISSLQFLLFYNFFFTIQAIEFAVEKKNHIPKTPKLFCFFLFLFLFFFSLFFFKCVFIDDVRNQRPVICCCSLIEIVQRVYNRLYFECRYKKKVTFFTSTKITKMEGNLSLAVKIFSALSLFMFLFRSWPVYILSHIHYSIYIYIYIYKQTYIYI